MSLPADLVLVKLIAAEVERDGGVALVSRLISYNPQIRKLLSDRRLLPFLQEWPTVFELLRSGGGGGGAEEEPDGDGKPAAGGQGATFRVKLVDGYALGIAAAEQQQGPGSRKRQEPDEAVEAPAHSCSGCGAGFRSRTALFKHLRGETAGTGDCSAVAAASAAEEAAAAASGCESPQVAAVRARESKECKALEQAVVFALRRRLLRMGRREEQGSDTNDAGVAASAVEYGHERSMAPLTWLASNKKAKVQRSLINYVRSLPSAADVATDSVVATRTPGLELLSEAWWADATRLLGAFLQAESRRELFEVVVEAGQGQAAVAAVANCNTIAEFYELFY